MPAGKYIVTVRMVIQKIKGDGAYTSRELFKYIYLKGTFHLGVQVIVSLRRMELLGLYCKYVGSIASGVNQDP